jgi:hypothetical protein
LDQLFLLVRVFLSEKQLEGSTDGFMIALIAVNVPILEHNQFFGLLRVEENAVTPGGSAFWIVHLFFLYVLVSGQEVDSGLAVHPKHAIRVV